ncbi:MAG: TrlF family AAA-like ATPase [Terriglobia bacterium]
MKHSDPIQRALNLPNGGRFYRCVLQVNPFDYIVRHNRPTAFSDETSYNKAILEACANLSVEVIAITDHYRVQTGSRLKQEAQAAGIHVFVGFEAVAKDGIHILCLFDPTRRTDEIERIIGECGVHRAASESPIGKYDARDLLKEAGKWGGVCVAAHVASKGGLLCTLSGQARIESWRSPFLHACSLPGPMADAPDHLRPILDNKDAAHRRERPVAILNAQDVSGPADLAKPGASCWIKMSEVTVEGLRQAFLDPVSRIRLASDPVPEEHSEFVAMAWEGGFLNEQAIHFNENLNVLVGGRGSGKSTIIESLRYALNLEPVGEEAKKTHAGIVSEVLRSGTKISLLVRSHRPSKREYLIERTIPNPAIVRDDTGSVLALTPLDVIPEVEVYGQHEIAELTKSREKLTRLLERFAERDSALARRKSDLRQKLERSRAAIMEAQRERKQIEERLAALPALEETLKRFQEAGLEERLKDQSLVVREEGVLKTASGRISPFRELHEQLRGQIPIDRAFLSAKALEALPGRDILGEASRVLGQLSQDFDKIAGDMSESIKRADGGLAVVAAQFEERKAGVLAAYQKILRELQKSKVDGEEFIRLRRQIEELRPLRERISALERERKESDEYRRNLLAEWEDAKSQEYRQFEHAAKKVTKQLSEKVRVQVSFAGNREPLFQLFREQLSGRLSEAIETLRNAPQLSLKDLADSCRSGKEALVRRFNLPPAQAERLTQASPEVVMRIEELDLQPTTNVELNIAGDGQPAVWKTLDDLSTGQKATAVLLLLLLESTAPLVVDQPEDDLDNRFITDSVVPKAREEKRRRQFVFSTHNANIPVLGDAELIVGLKASGEADAGQAVIPVEHLGSIDARPVRELVEEILEGGREAFEMRRLKYGF